MNFINFLSNKQMSEEHSDQEDYVGNILDNIHKKVEIYIKTHDIKLFSEEVTKKTDINRIQRQKQFIRSTRLQMNGTIYRQPPISKIKRPFSVSWEEQYTNKLKAKQFINKIKRQKQQLYGKFQQHKNKLKLMEKQNKIKEKQQTNFKMQSERQKRRMKAALTIQLNKLRNQQRKNGIIKNSRYRYHSLTNINQEQGEQFKIMQNEQYANSVAGSQLADNCGLISIKLPKINNPVNRSKTQTS